MQICRCGETLEEHKLLSPMFPVMVCKRPKCPCTHFTSAADHARAQR